MKPKVLQVSSSANWGAIGKIAEGINLSALEAGWEAAFAYGRDLNPCISPLWKVGNMPSVYAHYARHRLLDQEGRGSVLATKKFIARIKDFQPQIIHLHNIHDHWLNYPILFDYLSGCNSHIVWTLHDCWPFTGGCPYFDRMQCHQWQWGCKKCPDKRAIFNHSASNFVLKESCFTALGDKLTLVPVSHWLEELTKKSFLGKNKIQMIHNGIDTELFSPSAAKRRRVLGVAMPWTERKGLADFAELRKLLPDDFEMVLVGLSKKQIKSLPDGICGLAPTQDMKLLAELYSSATVLVNPTYEDTFPTVNLEAMACGTPVVTYNTGGSPEAIGKGTGLVVEQGDVSALASSVLEIAEGDGRFTSEQCRAHAVENFRREERFRDYIHLYTSLLNYFV